MTELEKRVKELETQVDEMKKLVIVIKDDPLRKELNDLKNAFMSGDMKLDEKISKLEKRVEKLEILQNEPE